MGTQEIVFTETPVSILLIDDHPLLRRGVRQLIDMEPDMVAVGEASNAADGIRKALEIEPDLILLDLNMPETNGLAALTRLRQENLSARIVIFTVSDHEDDVVEALKAGADGYLLKDMEPVDMVEQLRQATLGRMVISDKLTTLLAQALRSQHTPVPARPTPAHFTPREKGILLLIADGLSNKMIGRELGISDGTVKVHVKRLLKKLNLRSRVEVAVWVVEEGLRHQ